MLSCRLRLDVIAFTIIVYTAKKNGHVISKKYTCMPNRGIVFNCNGGFFRRMRNNVY